MPDLKTVTFDASRWQPIETAPQGTMLLCANMRAMQAQDWAYVAWIVDGRICGHRTDMPTHWMPLPAAPGSAPTPAAQSAEQEAVAHIVTRKDDGQRFLVFADKMTSWRKYSDDFDVTDLYAAPVNASEPVGSVKVIESGPAREVGEPILTLSKAFEDMLDHNPGKSFDLYAAPVNGGERDDARRMRTLCRLLDAADELGNGFPGEVHHAFQEGSKVARETLDRFASSEDEIAPVNGSECALAHDASDVRSDVIAAISGVWDRDTNIDDAADEVIDICSKALTSSAKPCEYCDDTGDVHDRTGEWRGTCTCPAGAAISSPAKVGGSTCQRCGGTGVVDDGEMTGCGGVEFESGPINCVKDCPDCAGPAKTGGEAATLVRDIKDAIGEISGAMTYPDLLDAIDQLAALTSPAKVGGDEREAFEHNERASDLRRDDEEGDYLNPCVQAAWEGWKARASAAPVNERVIALVNRLRDHHKRDIVDFDIYLEAASQLEYCAALSADGGEDKRDADDFVLVKRGLVGAAFSAARQGQTSEKIASLLLKAWRQQAVSLPATDDSANTIRALQKALAYWMPKVFDDRSAADAYLLMGYQGEDEASWGEAAQTDAERYREVRKSAYLWGIDDPSPQRLDAEVDAAIAANQAKGDAP